MRAARAILLYAVAVILLGAIFAPWLFWLVHPYLPEVPFRRIFDRSILIVSLVGLWPVLRALRIHSWAEFGLPSARDWWRQAGLGFGLGLLSFAAGGAILIGSGLRSLAGLPSGFFVMLMKFFGVGIVVGVLEEVIFRGGVFGALRRALPLVWAVILSSAIYSRVHFMKPNSAPTEPAAVDYASGFAHFGQIVGHTWQAPGVATSFVTLLLAGSILALAFVRTRSLYLSIGLHAGWVVALKSFAKLTTAHGHRQWWNGSGLVDSVVMWPVLVVMLVAVAILCRNKVDAAPS